MEVRPWKMPPLPSRKNGSIPQPQNRLARKLQPSFRRQQSASRLSKQIANNNKENSVDNSLKRPSSVRQLSRDSAKSRDSRNSRGSSRQKSLELNKRQIYNMKTRVSMPAVSAKSWSIYQMKQAKHIYGKRTFKRRQVASLTKIMNFITILQILDELVLNPHKIKIKVSREASCIIGTTAELKHDLEISVYDLYFGMMLPSGNDAAYQIAQIGGSLLLMSLKSGIQLPIVYDIQLFTEFCEKQQNSVKIYLAQMNKVSKRLGMLNSNFANPHGLSNPNNYSCAQDMCKLCIFSMENQTFRNIVATKSYEKMYSITIINEQCQEVKNADNSGPPDLAALEKYYFNSTVALKWQNTNKMLKDQWTGIKTGITPNAGPCLAASVQKYLSGRTFEFLVILISSSSMETRWKQVHELVNWVIDQKMYI